VARARCGPFHHIFQTAIMPQRKPFCVFDALVIAVLHYAGYQPDTLSVKDLETDGKALAIWNDKKTIRRHIYRSWPRDPTGEKLLPENSCLGKMTSNEIQFWGATLWDFYWVHRMPNVPNLITISTGSKLSKWMMERKETEHAASEIEWAQIEADPREINPYPIADAIEAQEMRIRLGLCGKSIPRIAGEVKGQEAGNKKVGPIRDSDSEQEPSEKPEGLERDEAKFDDKDQMAIDKKEERLDNSADSEQTSTETIKRESDEHDQQPVTVHCNLLNVRATDFRIIPQPHVTVRTDDFPAPWPLAPFSYEAPKIEQRVPLHMLPERLIVHDPGDLLSDPHRRYRGSKRTHDWTSVEKDKTYVYRLSLTPSGKNRREEELAVRKEQREQLRLDKLKKLGADSKSFPEGYDGMLLCPSMATPDPSEPPVFVIFPEAPDAKPAEEAHLYISPDRVAGEGNHSLVLHAEWEVPRSLLVPDILCNECLLEDVQKTLIKRYGEDGSHQAAVWKEKSGRWKQVDCIEPEIAMDIVLGSPDSGVQGSYLQDTSARRKTMFDYSGPVRSIKTNVQWQSTDNYCSHVLRRMHIDEQPKADAICPHPPIARVSLIAKLSTGDSHLGNEAKNYEEFPQHFFEHWNGYNVVKPLHKPVPVNAIVPQYYGYYVPETDDRKSPILLMENCGQEIRVQDLSMDDK
jgi:hypothetical protein